MPLGREEGCKERGRVLGGCWERGRVLAGRVSVGIGRKGVGVRRGEGGQLIASLYTVTVNYNC